MIKANVTALFLILLSIPFIATGGARDLCGALITADFDLEDDLACAGSGLIVAADGITVNLRGHVISGAGVGDGIAIVERTDVTVKDGRIQNFAAGVRIASSSDVTIKNSTFAANTDGIDCAAGCSGNAIKYNHFLDNVARGVMLRSSTSDNVVRDNVFARNRVGILLFGAVDTDVRKNILSSSLLADIRVNVLATGNVIKENTASTSPAGIEFLVTPTGSATGNSIVANTLIASPCGLKGPLAGNIVRKNVFVATTMEVCP
jgi:parallel beta-helix repeat protein